MSLTGLNRTFVAQGLKVMAGRKNVGLKALSDTASIDEAPTPYHLGFVLGPRINAGGRVGESFLGARLLSTENYDEAFEIAYKLDLYNQERRVLESKALEQAFLQVDPKSPALVLDRDSWHEGVIGIVAGRIKEKFNKPTAVITWNTEGIGKGSARSISGFDFGRFIHRAHHLGYVLGGGGHAMAAGFSLTKEQLPAFTDFLMTEFSRMGDTVDFRPTVLCDGYLDLRSLTPLFFEEIQRLTPFGMGNPSPKFIFGGVKVESFQLIQDQHIRCRFSQDDGFVIEGMGFRLKDTTLGKTLMDQTKRPLDLLASPKLDKWGGKTKVNLTVEDAAFASSSSL
jgi:single-stranded-DNA-specific exonuclease